MLRRSAELAGEAGMDPVHGPGLVVTLNDAQRDAKGRFPRDASPDDLVVHQQDIQAVLNALWSAGAEAIQMQDQRIIATSAPRCVGNTLLLNGRTYSPPYMITAIGDAAAMQAALAAAPLVILYKQYVVRFGLGYTEEVKPDVQIVGHTEPVRMHFATARRPDRLLTRPDRHRQRRRTVTWHDAGPGRRQLRQLRVQPGAVPRSARRGRRRCGATTTRGWPTEAAVAAPSSTACCSARARAPRSARARRSRWCAPAPRRATPLLGVCLGHQAIGVAFGATVDRAPELLHGKTSSVYPHQCRCAARTSGSVHRDALPLADDPARDAARRARGHRPHRERRDHGRAAHRTADPRRAVPPRVDPHRGRAPDAGQLAGRLRLGARRDAGAPARERGAAAVRPYSRRSGGY